MRATRHLFRFETPMTTRSELSRNSRRCCANVTSVIEDATVALSATKHLVGGIMRRSLVGTCLLVTAFVVLLMTSRTRAANPAADFGAFIQSQLRDHSEQLFGIEHPLEE